MQLSTEELRAAVLIARAAALNAEIAGMIAENQWRQSNGNAMAYDEAARVLTQHDPAFLEFDVPRNVVRIEREDRMPCA